MSILIKVAVVLFPIIVFIILRLLFRLLHLQSRFHIRVSDIFVFFLLAGLEGFTDKLANLSILPYYIMLISALGLVLLLLDLFVYRHFVFIKFFKRFWRSIGLLTTAMYLFLIIAALFMA